MDAQKGRIERRKATVESGRILRRATVVASSSFLGCASE